MNKQKLGFIEKRSIPRILKELSATDDVQEIKRFEDYMITALISSMGIVASFLNFGFRLYWQDPIMENLITSILLLFFALSIDFAVFRFSNAKLRVHLMSLCSIGIILTIAYSYYDRIGVIVWSAVVLIMIISIIRIDRIMYLYIAFAGFILHFYLFLTQFDSVVSLNKLYYSIQSVLFIIIFIVGLLWHRLYSHRFLRSHEQYMEVVDKKEELIQLNEEITATEEELRIQNECLQAYNLEIKENEKRLNHMAYNDALTGLANRKMIIEKMNLIIDISTENKTKFAVAFIDLDGFKKINDTMGHHIGDKFLVEVSRRLINNIKVHDTVGRFGGDEFALIISHNHKEDKLYEELEKLRMILYKPYHIDGLTLYASASFGVSIFPDDAQKVEDLIKTADAAMYKAKANGKNSIQFFRIEMKEEILNKIELEHELRKAVANNEFFLVYQPQVELARDVIKGFEALIRWQSPKRGLVSPLEFISVLEDMGLINEVGNWVLEEACKQVLAFKETYKRDFYISVNVSGVQMKNDQFVHFVKETIHKYQVDPKSIELEITESVFIDDLEATILRIHMLKDIGVRIALDDFGTGYSSLSYLRLLPLDVLKIDKSFIWDLEKGEKERKIVGSIIDLVHDMDITVVAEGVETEYQNDYLHKESCDYIQGYLISKPVGVEELHKLLKKHLS